MNKEKQLGDMPIDDFKKTGHQLIDWVANYLEDIESFPVLPNVEPGDIKEQLEKEIPQTGERLENILSDIDRIILPGITHWNHPGFMAYFNSTSSSPGILAELLSAAFNTNGMLWKTCPSSAELEEVALGWLRQAIGLPAKFFGIIYDTASVSTMHAIAAAREFYPELKIREKGMSGRTDLPKLKLYTSEQAHSSVEKGALTLGIGLDGIVKIPVNEKFQMQSDELRKAIKDDKVKGHFPFCVVATVGTTSTTAIDPVPEIVQICQEENIWLHIDAAHAGTSAIVPEMKHIIAGCEEADSFVVNPHKWMFTPVDLSVLYTCHPEILKRAFSIVPEYLKTSEDAQVINFMDYGIQLGRRFRSLKLWFIFRYFGLEGIIERLKEHLRLGKLFAQWIDEDENFERLAPTPFSTICFRAKPKGYTEEKLDELNQKLMDCVNKTGEILISHTKLNDVFVLRLVISGLRTEERHVRRAWEILKEQLRKIV